MPGAHQRVVALLLPILLTIACGVSPTTNMPPVPPGEPSVVDETSLTTAPDSETTEGGPEAGDEDSGTTDPPVEAPTKPQARGSPLNIPAFQIIGAPYSQGQASVEEAISVACGGTPCVAIRFEYEPDTPESLECTVTRIERPDPIFAGDTITFTLRLPCGTPEEESQEPPVEESSPEATTETGTENGTSS